MYEKKYYFIYQNKIFKKTIKLYSSVIKFDFDFNAKVLLLLNFVIMYG